MHHIILKKDIEDTNLLDINKEEYKDDYNHLVNSLRVKVGEDIRVDIESSNGDKDKAYIGKISDVNGDSIEIKYVECASFNELPIYINLYQGLPKQDKLEFIVEKATELGVYSIVPVSMKNCIKKMDGSDIKKIDRLKKIAYQASLQSMRHIIPDIKNPISFEEMIKDIKSNGSDDKEVYNILCYEDVSSIDTIDNVIDNIKSSLQQIKINNIKDKKIIVNIIIGPEGGFDKQEIEKAKSHNIGLYALGERILRTETAPIVALSQFINIKK
ncbi:MAG: 16S rRNA (uracil(1498)-N(3))-methyltransferase [Lachnospiraceae bacterium]|nr:16S rRNA (uracil(1498)-N(3))-methyltransferase [Lachnospiraceae bacterium]